MGRSKSQNVAFQYFWMYALKLFCTNPHLLNQFLLYLMQELNNLNNQ